jgi:hypothetical protein
VIAAWCWDLIEPYLKRNLLNRGIERPSRREILAEFARVWPEFTATLGVQEPFAGTIRFKWLVRFGGGKFKMNLHHGMHFVNTKNFKPESAPRWKDAPEINVDE